MLRNLSWNSRGNIVFSKLSQFLMNPTEISWKGLGCWWITFLFISVYAFRTLALAMKFCPCWPKVFQINWKKFGSIDILTLTALNSSFRFEKKLYCDEAKELTQIAQLTSSQLLSMWVYNAWGEVFEEELPYQCIMIGVENFHSHMIEGKEKPKFKILVYWGTNEFTVEIISCKLTSNHLERKNFVGSTNRTYRLNHRENWCDRSFFPFTIDLQYAAKSNIIRKKSETQRNEVHYSWWSIEFPCKSRDTDLCNETQDLQFAWWKITRLIWATFFILTIACELFSWSINSKFLW